MRIFRKSPIPTTIGATGEGNYEDIKGFCASAPIERVKELDYVLTPGVMLACQMMKMISILADRFTDLKAEFEAQLLEEAALNKAIAENLARVKL